MLEPVIENNRFYEGFIKAYQVGGIKGATKFISSKVECYDIEEYRDSIKHIRTEFCDEVEELSDKDDIDDFIKAVFDSLCEYDYYEARNMLSDQLSNYKYLRAFKRDLGYYIEKTQSTKRTINNVKDKDEIHNDISLMNETLSEESEGKMFYGFLKQFLPFKDSISHMNRYDELSKLERWQLDTVFHPDQKSTYPDRLDNYFELLRRKDINELFDAVEKILQVTASEERVKVLEYAFGQIFDRDMTHEQREEVKKELKPNLLLSRLTRGELQDFIVNSEICAETKLLIIESQQQQLFDTKEEWHNVLYDNKMYLQYSFYKDFLRDYPECREERSDIDKDEYELTDEQRSEAVEKLEEYELKNLLKIIGNPNLAQRMKWLIECYPSKKIVSDNNISSYFNLNDYDLTPLYYYYNIMQETIREYYERIGVDYDKIEINKELPRNIFYGIEIEEVGLSGKTDFATGYFTPTYDSSLSRVIKSAGKHSSSRSYEVDTGEYVSDKMETEEQRDLDEIMRQVTVLNFFGARENSTCGFHVHLSSQYEENYEGIGQVEEFGLPEDYDPDDFPPSYAKEDYEEVKDKQGFLVPHRISKEFYEMQNVLIKKFHVHTERVAKGNFNTKLISPEPDLREKFKIVNVHSATQGRGVEFRLFNLPDYIDRKVVEAYIDFATTYFAYIEEGNNTLEYAKNAYEDIMGEDFDALSTWETNDFLFDILMSQLELKDDTRKIIEHIDEIFELYATKSERYWYDDEDKDYYTRYDSVILDEIEEKVVQITEEEIEENELN